MDEKITKLTSRMKLKSGAPNESVSALHNNLGANFPSDYIRFLLEADGGEGAIGSSYLVLWSLADLLPLNEAYNVSEYAPGLFLIGSNGGGLAYAIDIRNNLSSFVELPFIGMSIDEIKYCANDFIGFLEYLFYKYK